MFANPFRKFRFRLKTLLVLTVGIAIGYSLNLQTFKLLTGRAPYASTLPLYVIEPPDIVQVDLASGSTAGMPAISGQHLVGPDGRINLATYGQVYVAGLTIDQAREAVEKHLSKFIDRPRVSFDVVAFNSKTYYVITQGTAPGDNVQQFPITGNETVLDAIAQAGGVPPASATKIFISRPTPNGAGGDTVLPVNWQEISRGTSTATNYAIMPRDRLIISQVAMPAAGN